MDPDRNAGAIGRACAVSFRAGVHLANDGALSAADLDLLSGLSLVKDLIRLDTMGKWGEVDWRALAGVLDPDCLVILRLYTGAVLRPAELAQRAAERLFAIRALLGPGRDILIEVGNEPNHSAGIEGYGKELDQARAFGVWYGQALAILRRYNLRGLGWPGLAVGEWGHGERTWAKANAAGIRASDWIGCHCYWQRPEELQDRRLGANWRYYRKRWPGRRLFVTEAANSACHNPELVQMDPGRQVAEYLDFCRQAAAGGVAGVAFFILGGSEDWAGFRLFPETVRALVGVDL